MESLRKAIENGESEKLEKAKYVKRTGSKGNYKYQYKQDGTGPHGQGKGPGKGKADGSGLKNKSKETDRLFSGDQIESLKKEWAGIKKINPDSTQAYKISDLINRIDGDKLEQLAGAGVKFVSAAAQSELSRRMNDGKAVKNLFTPQQRTQIADSLQNNPGFRKYMAKEFEFDGADKENEDEIIQNEIYEMDDEQLKAFDEEFNEKR